MMESIDGKDWGLTSANISWAMRHGRADIGHKAEKANICGAAFGLNKQSET